MAIEEEPPAGAPEWVLTYGDMMSLLLTFFIMLVSMSELKKEDPSKYQAALEALRKKFGYDLSKLSLMPGNQKNQGDNSVRSIITGAGRAKLFDTKSGGQTVKAPTGDHARVQNIRPGTSVLAGGIILFRGEEVELTDENKTQLEIAAETVRGKPQKIEIRGHTVGRPVSDGGPFRDNWDLAYARCRESMDYLVKQQGIDPRRIRLSVAAQNEPAHVGNDEVLQRLNSRVEVFITDEFTKDFIGTEEERSKIFTPVPQEKSKPQPIPEGTP